MNERTTSTSQMSSSEFVSFATKVWRRNKSWDDAPDAFPGRPRWDALSELELGVTRDDAACEVA